MGSLQGSRNQLSLTGIPGISPECIGDAKVISTVHLSPVHRGHPVLPALCLGPPLSFYSCDHLVEEHRRPDAVRAEQADDASLSRARGRMSEPHRVTPPRWSKKSK
jgi:hypothetical protein